MRSRGAGDRGEATGGAAMNFGTTGMLASPPPAPADEWISPPHVAYRRGATGAFRPLTLGRPSDSARYSRTSSRRIAGASIRTRSLITLRISPAEPFPLGDAATRRPLPSLFDAPAFFR